MLIFAVLIGVCYGVYSRINQKPSAPPPEAMVDWDNTEPKVQTLDGMGGPGDHKAAGPLGSGFMSGIPSGMNPSGGPPAGNPGGSPAGYPTGPGGAPGNGQMAGNPQAGGWDNPPASGTDPYGAPPAAGQVGPPGAGGAAPGFDPYGQPPMAGQDGGYGQIPPTAPDSGYGQMPAAGQDPAGGPGESFAPGADGGRVAGGMTPFTAAMEQARHELDIGRLSEAHAQLSQWYDNPNLTAQESQKLNELLDQLAGTVIYSTQNLIEPACEVQPGETLERIAERYNVPWQLLAKINGIDDPNSLRPGERLKVVRGPFSAVISLDKHTLTLMLNNQYAGRFTIGVGRDNPPPEGQYIIESKIVDPTYYGPGRQIEHGDPTNPLGRRWLGLGQQYGIHGTNDPRAVGRDDVPGSISMADRDIDDVFDILSEHSRVVVRR
jgi:LysM repeat protein